MAMRMGIGLRALQGLLALLLVVPALAQHTHQGAAKRRPPPLAIGAAFSPAGELWLVGLNDQQRLFVQTSSDDGKTWKEPRTLDTGQDRIAADGENRPKLVFGPAGRAVITYTEPMSKPYSGQIRMLRSDDGGATFSAPFTVHQDRQLITHRFESVAFDARGTLHTLWVDKRDLEALMSQSASAPAQPAATGAGQRAARPKVDYRGAAIYRNESTDGGKTFGPDIKVADHSCECCRIALAPSPDGSLAAMWRHVFAPNQRDHAFAILKAPRPTEPVRATFDRWAIDACPHHGPGLAPARGGGYHAVWFGERGGQGRVRYGRL
ncbi:MAG TPA: sialidase family protein, partial [Rubrivivax sp.]|nr:sialidase family protein [Rubrivivax sp.]